jgi:hypothetical protein
MRRTRIKNKKLNQEFILELIIVIFAKNEVKNLDGHLDMRFEKVIN